MAKTSAVWGIDIGQCALKALRCTLDADGETVIADKYDFIEYPKILSQPEADPEELIKEALELFLSRNDVVGDRVAISVSGQAGLSRFFKPPPVEVKTLPDIVKYEVKQQIPFPIEDVIWDWQQLGGSVVEGRAIDAEVGLFAMKREAVFRALHPFDEADVEVDYVQLSPLSIFNVICHDRIDELPDPEDFDPENPPESVVVMSMGTDTTDLIVTNGIKLWLRNIPIGGNHFTKQLSREMKLTQAKAEHLKRNTRVSENPKAIFQAMRPVFNDLVNEVQRSLTFFQSMEKSANLSEIVLLGNAAKLPGLRQFLSKQLEIDIAKVNEFKKLRGSDVVSQATFTNNLLSFAPCYGLCLQGLKKGHIKTNLLPQEIVVERIIRAKKPWVLAAVSALALGLMLGYVFNTNAWWRVNESYVGTNNLSWKKAISKVKSEDTKSNGFIETDKTLKQNLDKFNLLATELSSASEGKATWLEVYSALSQAFPKDKRIEDLKADPANAGRIAPDAVEFSDRKELYIDHIESAFFKDVGEWRTRAKPIYDNQAQESQEVLLQRLTEAGGVTASPVVDAAAETPVAAEGVVAENSGWVIEIKGHHFHNSVEALQQSVSDKAYLYRFFVLELLTKEDVVIPTMSDPDNKFSYEDIGISLPTIVQSSGRIKKPIVFDPTATSAGEDEAASGGRGGLGGAGAGAGGLGGPGLGGGLGGPAGGTTGEDGKTTYETMEYKFVVQMIWKPRTEKERIAARAVRRKAQAEAATAAEEKQAANDAAASQQ